MIRKNRILVVDDDEMLLSLVGAMLVQLGYQIHSVDNGREALKIMEQGGGDFDLLLTDISMPRINGFELARSCKEKHPGLKVLLMTGSCDTSPTDGKENPAAGFLRKPFTFQQLRETIGRTLC